LKNILPKSAFCCAFFVGKKLNAKDIHKEISPVYGGKILPRLAFVTNVSLITKRLRRKCGSGRDSSQKNYNAEGFDVLAKRWNNLINVFKGYMEK
jgi:hypothetical protein